MVILSQNKKALKTIGLYFLISISASIIFFLVSYQFKYVDLIEFSIIFNFLFLIFLIISALFAFSLGQILVRIYRDKDHKHIEENSEISQSELNILQLPHEHVNPGIIKSENPNTIKENSIEQRNTKLNNNYCKQCSKEVYNPYKCNGCSNYYCGEHILTIDHDCI